MEHVAGAAPQRRGRLLTIIAAAVLIGLALVAVIARAFMPHGTPAPNFTLTDQYGRPFTLANQHGKAVALFFGYTHCPDVCPTTLADLAHAKRLLGSAASDLVVAFVTVDPARDSRAVMGRYVRLFDPSFIGLTGTPTQLDPVYSAYHIYHQRLPAQSALGYLVAHSSTIEFIGRDGSVRGFGDASDTLQQLTTEMRSALS